MTRFLLAGAAAFGMMTGAAMAQMSTSDTTISTTTTTPVPVAPVTTTAGTTVGNAVLPDGDQTSTKGTSYIDNNGVKTETTITNQSYPLSNMIMQTKKTTTIANGVATETTTMTTTYPGTANAPVVTSATRTYQVGAQ